ncbi:MAG: DUF192 domain-containing protein [Halobacteriaceae archaeon]
MRVVHDDGSGPVTVAEDVSVARTLLQRMRGLMFRPALADGEAMVFRFDGVGVRRLHAMFVSGAFDAVWVRDGTVTNVARLRPWVGYGSGVADLVVELPSGTATPIAVGDRVAVRADEVGTPTG